ncbi:ABC transporter substrate-binding protein [Salipaludibacillus keqinensis]|uniref:ABC transporter substrate-binding protein n=1 Tax=Salipaludibacillus keqinensis TaxID=2045207 RepID=A0A323TD65_9BACI|nr:zinc ABC transporter substrate-binding protein [Salipaludibacillus keqinensis]PYZ93312.1 ABC transporter substrate-binding protein [Salipaludibacillus keqinensis]
MKACLMLSGAGLLLLSACGTSENNDTNELDEKGEEQAQSGNSEEVEPVEIYTTIFALEDFINKIGQEHVDVENIIPPGVDAHTYEPPMRLMTRLAEADAFVYSGGGMEGFIDTAVNVLEEEDVNMVKASQGIEFIDETSHSHAHEDEEHHHDHSHDDNRDHSHDDNDHNHSHNDEENDHDHAHDHDDNNHHSHGEEGHDHGPGDPHVFIDPIRSIQLAENISEALIELKPEEEDFFRENFADLKEDLERLDEKFQEVAVKAERKELFTAHAGYTYWADRYGFEQVPVTGFSPLNEPSQREIQDLIALATEKDIEYIVFERNYSIPVADMLIDEIGAEKLYFDNMESLTEDQRKEDQNYVELMEQNIETLEKALK